MNNSFFISLSVFLSPIIWETRISLANQEVKGSSYSWPMHKACGGGGGGQSKSAPLM
jgi:hypothetical protein